MSQVSKKVDEVNQELARLIKIANECRNRAECDADERAHMVRVIETQQKVIQSLYEFAQCCTWCLRATDRTEQNNYLYPDFVRASFVGHADGLTFGMIWRDDSGIPEWRIHV